jgi:NADPH-dependent glutamate synthase beta subunit-like oxidoreductase
VRKVARDDKGRPSLAEIEGSEQIIECDTVILAMGFTGPEPALVKDFGTDTTPQVRLSKLAMPLSIDGGHGQKHGFQ